VICGFYYERHELGHFAFVDFTFGAIAVYADDDKVLWWGRLRAVVQKR